jgi:hypothetical protein
MMSDHCEGMKGLLPNVKCNRRVSVWQNSSVLLDEFSAKKAGAFSRSVSASRKDTSINIPSKITSQLLIWNTLFLDHNDAVVKEINNFY